MKKTIGQSSFNLNKYSIAFKKFALSLKVLRDLQILFEFDFTAIRIM